MLLTRQRLTGNMTLIRFILEYRRACKQACHCPPRKAFSAIFYGFFFYVKIPSSSAKTAAAAASMLISSAAAVASSRFLYFFFFLVFSGF